MLENARITTILPVVDRERARQFYSRKLGLHEEGEGAEGEIIFAGGGGTLALVPRGPTSSKHTAVSFEVQKIEDEIRELTSRGVIFEDYDFPDLKTVDKICVLSGQKAAWFKDSEGNTLCLHESRPIAH